MWPPRKGGCRKKCPPRRPGPQERGLGLCATQWCILPATIWFLNSSSAGTRPKAPGRRPCYPTRSPPAPQKLKAGHPFPPPKEELKAQGLAWSSSVYRVCSLHFQMATVAQRGACRGHTAIQGGGSARTRRPASRPSSALGTSLHSHGGSWQEARPVTHLWLSVRPSPQPHAGEGTTAPQVRASAPAPTREKSPLSPRASPWGGSRRRAERWGRAPRPRGSGGCEPTLGSSEGPTFGGTVRRSQVAGSSSHQVLGTLEFRLRPRPLLSPGEREDPAPARPGLSSGKSQTKSWEK